MNWQSEAYASLPSVQQLTNVRFLSLTSLIIFLAADASATNTLFECVDSHGKPVFTDSPHQLLTCQAIDFSSLQHSLSSSPPAGVPSTSGAGPDAEKSFPTAPVPSEPQTARIPVERVENILIVSATLNGSTQARLIIDTGASQTIISQRLALDLGLYSTAHTTQVLLHTASGSVKANAVTLDSIRIGEAEIRNSQVLIHTLPDLPFAVDGLLGLSFLGAYQITLDTSRGELHLKSSSEKFGGLVEKK